MQGNRFRDKILALHMSTIRVANSASFRICKYFLILAIGGSPGLPSALASTNVPDQPDIRIWLLPAEPGLQPGAADTRPTDEDIDRFVKEFVPKGVVLENATDPRLRTQLGVWNPEFAVPNLAWLRGQTVTLKALGRFASDHNIQVRVRFWTWASIFGALQEAWMDGTPPDLSQVGSGWIANLQDRGMLVPIGTSVPLRTRRDYQGIQGISLRYTKDIRLLFFWRRLPRLDSPVFVIDHSSWNKLVDSLAHQEAPPIAFPTGATLNLIHDLLPLMGADPARLFHNGITGPYVRFDVTSRSVPKLFSREAIVYDTHHLPRRLIAFPEMSHEEALRTFIAGGYLGIIEPVGFLRRWFDEFSTTTAKQPGIKSFWEHAGVIAPPTAFKGGSDLVLFKTTKNRELTRQLAIFLASDPEYTEMLAANGNLPVLREQDAVRLLLRPIQKDDSSRRAIDLIAGQIASSEKIGREEPVLASWPEHFESREVIEAFQNVWRRIAYGNERDVDRAVNDLEDTINKQINPATQFRSAAIRIWPLLSFMILGMAAIVVWFSFQRAAVAEKARQASDHARLSAVEARRQSEQSRDLAVQARLASERARKIQGFTASALGVVDKVHRRKAPFSGENSSVATAEKSALVAVGLDGWLRGLDPAHWTPGPLCNVIWRSIILALDFHIEPGLYDLWSTDSSGSSPEAFLHGRQLLRSSRDPGSASIDVYFDITCPPNIMIDTPFMMEQCLTCAFQNALAASEMPGEGYSRLKSFRPIDVYATHDYVEIRNFCSRPFSPKLASVLNEDLTVPEFVSRIRSLLKGPERDRPGLGSIVIALVARECYGGLEIVGNQEQTSTIVRVRPEKSRWRSTIVSEQIEEV